MGNGIQPADPGFFSVLAGAGSLRAAARELGITMPAVSKHLALMEPRVGLSLVNRTTRRILGQIDDMEQLLGAMSSQHRGSMRQGTGQRPRPDARGAGPAFA